MDKQILKISPSTHELSTVENIVKCPESNCRSVFKCTSNLRMHLVKHHKLANELAKHGAITQYYCPIDDCKYSIKASKSFAKMKYLKQHYLKCHAPKEHCCEKCDKKFSTQTMLIAHTRSCGKTFVCSCDWTFTSKEALMTHCKRKGHNSAWCAEDSTDKVDKPVTKERTVKRDKNSPSKEEEGVKSSKEQGESMEEEENTVVKVCIASPPHSRSPRKPSSDLTVFPTHYIAAIALSELSTTFIIPKNCHIGVQTVDAKLGKKKSPNSDKKRKNSQETQTAGLTNKVKKKKICAETQTSSHLKRKVTTKVLTRRRKKSSETQTKHPVATTAKPDNMDMHMFNDSSLSDSSANEGQHKESTMPMDDDSVWGCYDKKSNSQSKPFITTINSNVFNINKEISIGSRGTEFPLSSLSNFDINKLCNNETQTELDCLLQNEGEGTSTTETQTTEELMGELLYSNTCTQTCDDVNELFDFNFVDIETQTAWPDL